ncbi:MAG: 16S rRNA (guanine(966)-N(2))-methyltransferase RsmD [Candidatus Omnitrophota bacterium]
MKIIGGEFKGRRIEIPKGVQLRPTSDKVREALFNIIKDRVIGASVLDLFAGTGSLGLEALSRGAKSVTFIDLHKRCVDTIKKNLRELQIDSAGKARVHNNDAFKALRKLGDLKSKFDLIFLDPPYYDNMTKKSLMYICNYDILNPSYLIICEHFKKDPMPDKVECLTNVRQARYGDTVLTFYAGNRDEKSGIPRDI